MVRRAVQAHAQYGLHFYDGMIVATFLPSLLARAARKDVIYCSNLPSHDPTIHNQS